MYIEYVSYREQIKDAPADDVRRSIIRHYLDSSLSQLEIGVEYEVDRKTIGRWVKRYTTIEERSVKNSKSAKKRWQDCIRDEMSIRMREGYAQSSYDRGLHLRGERNPQAKLSNVEVLEIKRRYSPSTSMYKLGKEFGISPSTVHGIVSGKTWKHLNG